MGRKWWLWVGATLALAAACASNAEERDAGPLDVAHPPGGAAGEGGAPLESGGGAPAEAGASPTGSGAGAGGVSDEDEESQNLCGPGGYWESGCHSCPAKPSSPRELDCLDFVNAELIDGALDISFSQPIHEAYASKVAISWLDDQGDSGQASVGYTRSSPGALHLGLRGVPATAQALTLSDLQISDVCGFEYIARRLSLHRAEDWRCGSVTP